MEDKKVNANLGGFYCVVHNLNHDGKGCPECKLRDLKAAVGNDFPRAKVQYPYPMNAPEDMRGAVASVLDHGHVRLVDYMGGDLSIVRAARVSYNAAWRAGEDEKGDEKLIRYLLNHDHSTPFESVVFTFDIKLPLFAIRQWHRHRIGWSYNEMPARYSELPEEFYVPDPAMVGVQSASSKQARTFIEDRDATLKTRFMTDFMANHCAKAFVLYRSLLADGMPRELARCVLPVSTYTQMFATVNLRALMHFCTLRLHPHAQYEIRVYAKAMLDLIRPVCPVAVDAFEKKEAHTMSP